MLKMSSIDKSLYCDGCNTLFKTDHESRTSQSRLPLLLKCGHSLCETCVRTALKNGKTSLMCQNCPTVTEVDVEEPLTRSLPINVHVLGQCAVRKSSPGATGVSLDRIGAIIKPPLPDSSLPESENNELCSECCRVEAAVTCVKCESNVCKKCFDKIHQAKVLRKHKAIPLLREEDLGTCAVHTDRPVEYYCDDDDTVICSRCYIVGEHQGHSITPLEEKNKSVQATLEPAIDNAAKFVRKAGQTIKILNSLTPEWRCELDKKIFEVRGQFHAMHSQLQLREQEMILEVEKAFSDTTMPLMSIKRDLEQDLSAFERLVNTARRLRTGTDGRANAAQVLNQLLKVSDRPCAVEVPPNKIQSDMTFQFDMKPMKAAIAKFGEIQVPEKESQGYRMLTISDCPEIEEDVESVTSSSKASVIIEETSSDTMSVSSSTEDSGPRGRKSRGRRLRSRDEETDEDHLPPPMRSKPEKILKRKELASAKLGNYRSEMASVCHIKNPCHFLVQMQSAKQNLDMMSADINRWCKSVEGRKAPNQVQIDGLYLGQFSADKRWYRARVKRLTRCEDDDEDLAFVHYVDYGNSETIPITKLREMPAKFFREPEFAIRCSLMDIVPTGCQEWTEQANNTFARMTGENLMHLVVLHHTSDTLFVDLSRPPCHDISNDQPISIRDALVFLELASFTSPHSIGRRSSVKERQYHCNPIPESGDRLNGFVCHVDSPDSFYIQSVGEEVAYLSTMSQDLHHKYSSDKNDVWTIFCPLVGMICVARMPSDDCWYRAQVTGLPGGRMVQVVYVDYGNSEVVSVWDVKKISDEYIILPPQAIRCALADVKPLDGLNWPQDTLVDFSTAALHKLFIFDVKERIREQTIAVIAQDGMENTDFNLNVWLVQNGHAFSSGSGSIARKGAPRTRGAKTEAAPSSGNRVGSIDIGKFDHFARPAHLNALQRLVDKQKLDIELCIVDQGIDGQMFSAVVSRMVSPGEIYIQSSNASEILEKLKFDLKAEYGTSTFETEMVWLAGLNVAVFCEENGDWYRATILDIADESVKIRLLDYGDQQIVKLLCLRLLKPELVAQPCQALKCHLDGIQPAGGSQWSITSKELLSEAILPPKRCKVLKKGEPVDESTPIDLLIEEVIPADALNAARSEHISISKFLVEKGVALPIKSKSPKPPKPISKEEEAEEEAVARAEQLAREREARARSAACKANERTKYPPMIPPDKTTLVVVPTYLDYDCILYVQDLETHSEALKLVMDDIDAVFHDSEPEFDTKWKVGQAVTAQFSDDQQWYRGLIKSIDKKGILVSYVDFGNSEYVHPSRLRSDIYHMTVPRLSYPCIIEGLETSSGDGVWPVSSLNYIHNLLVAHQCLIKILKPPEVDKPLIVKLTMQNQEDLVEYLIKSGHALSPFEMSLYEKPAATKPEGNTGADAQKLEDDVTNGNDFIEPVPDVVQSSSCNGTISLASNVIKAISDVTETVTGGNESVTSLERSPVADSAESDDGIRVMADAKSRSADEYFSESGQSGGGQSGSDSPPKVTRTSRQEDDNRKSWSEIVDESGVDVIYELQPRNSEYRQLKPPDNGMYAGFGITNFIEPNLFFAQRMMCQDDSEESLEVNNQLQALVHIVESLNQEAESLDRITPTTARVGQACCARYSHDQCWYRAEIINIQEQYYTVLFVDYGNKEVQFVEDIRILPLKYRELPAQALLMRIAGLAPIGDRWSLEAQQGMQLIGQSAACVVKTVDSDLWPPHVAMYDSLPLMGEQATLMYQDLVDQGLVKLVQD